MKIVIQIRLETDGDYRLENADSYKMSSGFEDYCGDFVFDENTPLYPYEGFNYIGFDAAWRARRLLEHMLCDIRVIHSHYYVLDYMFHMFYDAMQAIKDKKRYHEGFVSGNYDGTTIRVYIEE